MERTRLIQNGVYETKLRAAATGWLINILLKDMSRKLLEFKNKINRQKIIMNLRVISAVVVVRSIIFDFTW